MVYFQTLQNFMYTMLKDNSPVAAKMSLVSKCLQLRLACIYAQSELYKPRHEKTISYAKTKTQISFAVTTKLISAFVFATWIVQSLYFLNPKFQASCHLLWLYSLDYVGPGLKPECWFSHDTAHILNLAVVLAPACKSDSKCESVLNIKLKRNLIISIEGSNMIFHSLMFAQSRGKC